MKIVPIRKDFNGQPMDWLRKEDGSLWLTAEQIGRGLGYAAGQERKSILKLASRYESDVRDFRSVVKMVTEAGPREMAVFEETAVYLFACMAKTRRASAFRRWVADTCKALRSGDMVLVPREELERRDQLATDAFKAIELQTAANKKMASLAGQLLQARQAQIREERSLGLSLADFPLYEALDDEGEEEPPTAAVLARN